MKRMSLKRQIKQHRRRQGGWGKGDLAGVLHHHACRNPSAKNPMKTSFQPWGGAPAVLLGQAPKSYHQLARDSGMYSASRMRDDVHHTSIKTACEDDFGILCKILAY